jgi:hypothetical protein
MLSLSDLPLVPSARVDRLSWSVHLTFHIVSPGPSWHLISVILGRAGPVASAADLRGSSAPAKPDATGENERAAVKATNSAGERQWIEPTCLPAGTRPAAESLVQLVKERKGPTHAPKRVEFVGQLPLTPVGKVDKKIVRAPYWTGHQRMVG